MARIRRQGGDAASHLRVIRSPLAAWTSRSVTPMRDRPVRFGAHEMLPLHHVCPTRENMTCAPVELTTAKFLVITVATLTTELKPPGISRHIEKSG